ncbi:MAG: hypothetical protein ACLRFE_03545 [Clostridia bacterium]
MNKYLKILMLSGGLVGAIAPTAIDTDKCPTCDFGGIYEDVEKMKQALPRLSCIDYKLNIDLSDNSNSENSNNDTLNETNQEEFNNVEVNDNIIDDSNSNNDSNVTFTTTDENGEQTILDNEETINFLDEALNQTNIEYEQLKSTLTKAITDTMNYLELCNSDEKTLTNEQKIYIKEHSNTIKFLAETLEDLSEDVICCIDGGDNCEDCDDEFELTAGKYLAIINHLEDRINILNNAIASLQFINNGNHFIARINPYYVYSNDTDQDSCEGNDCSIEVEKKDLNTDEASNGMVDEDENTQHVVDENNQTDLSVSNNEDKPTTFGLKSNIDTYAPTRRNIDTFFNTALYKNEFNSNGYGYGYGMPYGYGAGYGYGMPYANGYANPYGEINSNMINRSQLENDANQNNNTNNDEQNKTLKSKKVKNSAKKRAKNVDTYNGITIKSNINTMGESKISKFFKEKFNDIRRKVRKQTTEINETIPNEINNNVDSIVENNADNQLNNVSDVSNTLNDKLPTPHLEENIKA